MVNSAEERLDYLNYLPKVDEIKAVIIGQDPYPKDPTGIAFCKPKISDIFREYCSGKYVLNSLGLTEKLVLENKELFKTPKDIFYYLFDNGVVLINISNHILKGEFITGQSKSEFNRKLFENNKDYILEAKEYNEHFIKKAEKIFLLGRWKTQPIFEKFYPEYLANKVLIHPSNYNTKNSDKIEEWKKTYCTKHILDLINR